MDGRWDDYGSRPGGIRTPDPLIKSQLLYQLSYEPKCLLLLDFGSQVREALAEPAGDSGR